MNALSISALLLAALFIFTWWLARKIANQSIVDVAWALSFAPVAIVHAMLGGGWLPRRLVIASLIVLWSMRLGIYLWRRVAAHHPHIDPRYTILRERWSTNPERAFFLFFLSQGLLVWLLMLPVFLISRNAIDSFHPLEVAGFALWCLALIGEAIADAQLKQFKKTSMDPLAVCQQGLWRFSRHPNYFFQSLLWWGLFLMALPISWGWTAIIAPLAMLHFILNVTGIPLTEELAIKKRGDLYRNYQRITSSFIPLPPNNHS
ncbi:MAG: DUF1295 domain-containing protein [Verrucomicrobiaceae bacterium]|nr:DUF1295 domain-containing protein [Verrucomicrobiaceae bacterium]